MRFGYRQPGIVPVPNELVDEWIGRHRELFYGYRDQLVLGQLHKVSHPPCIFAVSKHRGDVSRLVGVGAFDEEASIDVFWQDIYRLEKQLLPSGVQRQEDYPLELPDRERVESLLQVIRAEVFFEVAHWL